MYVIEKTLKEFSETDRQAVLEINLCNGFIAIKPFVKSDRNKDTRIELSAYGSDAHVLRLKTIVTQASRNEEGDWVADNIIEQMFTLDVETIQSVSIVYITEYEQY